MNDLPPPPFVLGVIGYSGSGKTSLLERLVPALVRKGYDIGYFKANVHRIDLDKKGKDTYRIRSAGAKTAVISGRGGPIFFPSKNFVINAFDGRRHFESDPTPEELIASRPLHDHLDRATFWNLQSIFRQCDIVLVEGMKYSFLPKILVNRKDRADGELGTENLRNILLHLQWPHLPENWDEPVSQCVEVIESSLNAVVRTNARDLIGTVLAGGGSRRMGTDKALFPWPYNRGADGSATGTWLENALLRLSGYVGEVWVVGRIENAGSDSLPNLIDPVQSHLDVMPDAGPLGGLVTALSVAGGKGALVIPCDLPLLNSELLGRLIVNRDRQAGATVFRTHDGLPEPAVLILESHALTGLREFVHSGGRRAGEFLERIQTNWLELPERLSSCFTNFNERGDLEALE